MRIAALQQNKQKKLLQQQQQQQQQQQMMGVDEQQMQDDDNVEIKRIHHNHQIDSSFYNGYDDVVCNDQYYSHERKQPCYMTVVDPTTSSEATEHQLLELLGWFMPPPDKYSLYFNQFQIQQLNYIKDTPSSSASSSKSTSTTSTQQNIKCNHTQCMNLPAFTSMTAYENHYYSVHCYECSVCSKSLPSYKWLECHLLEVHDKMFAQLALKHQLFDCIVNDCKQKFWTDRVRKEHLVSYHRFPEAFEFHTQPILDQMITLHQNIVQYQQQLQHQQQQLQQQQQSRPN
ncbi:hypothetical protein DFA_06788 [Cavenderia fasciculata]|uniref:C2H2-type domain-containing protein n=1 Tax=Cavenderia fasciculata TaxID=261658 RepID=F4Q2A1_CACFS|nr:uncharacterized protein DFA_06788 [Cavenderia fasciculata]EGG18121.1 hypothetical protein DFA_06788 [Cavenderia fasciculata]|eukprot:XP_004366162.1 hypothetical protein DFA_06788 [Cavenderia fasciculata]